MRRSWSAEEADRALDLIDEDWRLMGNKSGATRLGLVLLKFVEIESGGMAPTSTLRGDSIST